MYGLSHYVIHPSQSCSVASYPTFPFPPTSSSAYPSSQYSSSCFYFTRFYSLLSPTGDTSKQSFLSFRYGGLTGYIRACFTAHGRPCTEFTKNGLTETYFCNKKQNESNMAEGVFLNSGMQRLTISEGPRAFER